MIICSALRHRRWISVRVLACFVGLAQSLQLAISPARLYLRELHNVISSRRSWNSDVRLSRQGLSDLNWWVDIDKQHLRRAIFREATTATLYTDASKSGWGGVLNRTTIVHGIWTRTESAEHITYLELLGVLRSVTALLPRLKMRRVLLFVDNQAVVYVIRNFTTRSPIMMAELRNLVALCETNNARLSVQWVPTDLNTADAPSRYKGSDHWRLDPRIFHAVTKRLQLMPTVDRFATAGTTLLPRWNSPCPEQGAEEVDGLSQDWTSEVNWLHPPLDLLPDVATKLERNPALGIVVTPFWPTEHWFHVLHRLSDQLVVVPNCRSLVCQHTRSVFGRDAQGDWPLAFWRLDPGQASIGKLCPVQWVLKHSLFE